MEEGWEDVEGSNDGMLDGCELGDELGELGWRDGALVGEDVGVPGGRVGPLDGKLLDDELGIFDDELDGWLDG